MDTRKTFLLQLAGGAWLVSACGGGGDGGGATATPAGAGGCSATATGDNHGHAPSIPSADLSSTTAMTYSIQGAADHSRDVTSSPAQLKAGQPVTVQSTVTLSHFHDVTESCA